MIISDQRELGKTWGKMRLVRFVCRTTDSVEKVQSTSKSTSKSNIIIAVIIIIVVIILIQPLQRKALIPLSLTFQTECSFKQPFLRNYCKLQNQL